MVRLRFPAPVVALLGSVAVLLVAPPAQATTMYEFSRTELSWVADLIAEAVVESSTSEAVEGREDIRTVTQLRLVHVLKGAGIEGDLVELHNDGGRLGGVTMEIPSTPVFAPGQRVLVFLEHKGGIYRTIGLNQSVRTLVEEAGSGRDLLVGVQLPYGLTEFDEGQVFLPPPGWRRYADEFIAAVQADVLGDVLPAYDSIPGLAPHKDRRFKKRALAEGQSVDPRYFAPGELDALRTEIEEEQR